MVDLSVVWRKEKRMPHTRGRSNSKLMVRLREVVRYGLCGWSRDRYGTIR